MDTINTPHMPHTPHTLHSLADVRAWRSDLDVAAGGRARVGFVPTMGFLHEGHLSLVRRAAAETEHVVVSIFVNPAQFGPREDLQAYPRDLERDLALLGSTGVCDMVFTPSAAEVYPPGFQTWVDVGDVAAPLEGARRPGHFKGVATVVAKMFGMVEPAVAYFGQKDAQQLAVIRTMVRDLNLPVQIVGCPTVREADGLAMSSRNSYLNAAERQAATVLYHALSTAQRRREAGERDAERLREAMREVLAGEPLADVEYVSAADPLTLVELDRIDDDGVLLSMAVRIGRTRLIDNVVAD